MALTKSKTIYSTGYAPLMASPLPICTQAYNLIRLSLSQPGVYATPFPYAHQMGLPMSTPTDTLIDQCLFQLDLVLAQQTSPSDTAAILLEPVLGEGGYTPAPKRFLEGLRRVCDKYGMLLIIDEVQSGFGRTGTMFNIEQSGVRPDILIMAKGIANGFRAPSPPSRNTAPH